MPTSGPRLRLPLLPTLQAPSSQSQRQTTWKGGIRDSYIHVLWLYVCGRRIRGPWKCCCCHVALSPEASRRGRRANAEPASTHAKPCHGNWRRHMGLCVWNEAISNCGGVASQEKVACGSRTQDRGLRRPYIRHECQRPPLSTSWWLPLSTSWRPFRPPRHRISAMGMHAAGIPGSATGHWGDGRPGQSSGRRAVKLNAPCLARSGMQRAEGFKR